MKLFKSLFKDKRKKTQVFEISLPTIQASFDQMQHQANWDTSQKFYWGYYFLDHNLNKMKSFAQKLKDNFSIIEIRNIQNNMYLLHIEEHVYHQPKSLFDQCQNLAKLAQNNNIEVFDGWDVELLKLNKPLVN